MKRPGLTFNGAAIGGFLLRHVEKLVVTVVGLSCLGLAWGAIDAIRSQSVRPQQTPKAIQAQAEAAARHIEQAKPTAVAKLPQGRLTAAIDPWRPGRVKLAEPPPAETVLLDRPMFAELAKRGVPDVFPIEDLRAVAGVALVRDTKPAAPAPAAAEPEPEPKPGTRGGPGGGRGRPRDPAPPEAPAPLEAAPAPFAGPEAGGEASVLEPFVVVTGLIPAQKQQAEFARRFGNASLRQADRDAPRWGVYRVERSVVVPGGTPRWEPLKVTNVETRDRPGAAPAAGQPGGGTALAVETEVLPKSFFLGPAESEIGYSAALPQRLDNPWGAAAFHPWFLPRVKRLLAEDPAASGDGPVEERLDLAAAVAAAPKSAGLTLVIEGVTLVGEPQPQEKVKQLLALEARGQDGAAPVKAGPIGAADSPVFAISTVWGERLAFDGASLSGKPANLRVRIDMVGRTPVLRILAVELVDAAGGSTLEELAPEPVGAGAGAVAGPPGTTPQERGLEYRLFRFVDLDVEPGRQYRYRVKFALRNPNFGLNQQHLAVAAAAKGEFLVSPYSNETPPISVPDPTAVLVRSLAADDAKSMKIKPGMVEMLVLAGDAEGGGLSLRTLVAEPGALVDVDAKLNKPGDTRCRGADVETGRILVDARGRQAPPEKADARSRRPPEPLELLVMQPSENTFEVVSLAESQPLFDRHRSTLPVVEDKRKDKPGRPGQPGAAPFDATAPFPGLPPR